jgi:eukaryotic translation initiation factor 2C
MVSVLQSSLEPLLTRYRCMQNYPNGLNVMVDLDAEQGRPAGRTPNTFRLVVRPTRTVNMAVLTSWLRGQTSMTEAVLEALSESLGCC